MIISAFFGISLFLRKYLKICNLYSLIISTCGLAPIFLAFPEMYSDGFEMYDYCVNAIFGLDIIFNFFSAYYDFDFQIVDSIKVRTKFVLICLENFLEICDIMVHS